MGWDDVIGEPGSQRQISLPGHRCQATSQTTAGCLLTWKQESKKKQKKTCLFQDWRHDLKICAGNINVNDAILGQQAFIHKKTGQSYIKLYSHLCFLFKTRTKTCQWTTARKDIPPGKLFSHFDPNVFEIFKVKAWPCCCGHARCCLWRRVTPSPAPRPVTMGSQPTHYIYI